MPTLPYSLTIETEFECLKVKNICQAFAVEVFFEFKNFSNNEYRSKVLCKTSEYSWYAYTSLPWSQTTSTGYKPMDDLVRFFFYEMEMYPPEPRTRREQEILEFCW